LRGGRYLFDFKGPGLALSQLTVGLAGRHNVENAVAAIALALHAGVKPEALPEALATFKGVKRRFEYVIQSASLIVIDDYAHHPEELRAAIRSARELFPGKRLTGVFQPHLFTRTRDFADGFAEVLSELDQCILLPIYPARELPLPGIDSQWLLDKIQTKSKKLLGKSELLAELRANRPEVLMMMGAGDIDALVQPIASGLR
jgi:UDP-N-acetylmuramate--alanine ligase